MGVRGGGDSELGEDVLDLLFGRAAGYPEGLCDASVRLPLGYELEHLAFSWRERVEGLCPPSGRQRSTMSLGSRQRRPTISAPRTPTCQPTRNTRRSSRSPCALRVLSRRVRRMTPKRRKRRGESVPSPEQDKAEVVRAVLTRWEIGVVTSAAVETARDHRHATLLLWPGGRNPTAALLLGRWIPMWYPPMATSSSARDPVMRFSAVRT